ncbi:MAG: hypothetical protein BGO63_16895 [Candidatus Accumulibacter sp. 66-26]|nr:diguanylate cyclase [Accumulibacter sp.]OJW50888.1 MAG: hypothetical protein BGO63_16895 [Candidatus Accumulibacter sp. 66-26]
MSSLFAVFRRPQSFRSRLLLLFGLLGVGIALALALAIGQLHQQYLRHVQEARLADLAESVSGILGDAIFERHREITLLAGTPLLTGQPLTAPELRTQLERRRATYPHYAWIGIADPDGRVLAATDGLLVGADVGKRPWFAAGRRAPMLGDVHEAVLLAQKLPPAPNGEPLRFIDFAAPIYAADGTLRGVLGAHGSWEWVREVGQRVVHTARRAEGIELLILNRKGEVIFAEESPAAVPALDRLRPGSAIVDWPNGASYLVGVAAPPQRAPYAELGWTVLVRQPVERAFAGARALSHATFVFGVLAALVFIGAAWPATGRIAAPLRAMASIARRIEAGERGLAMPTPPRQDEIAQLAQAVDGMTRRLVEHETELEARVRERTAELAEANAQLATLASRDGLTGALNRRAGDERLAAEVQRAGRSGQALAALMVDVDHFKRVNDSFGHAAGDTVLREVGALLGSAVRGSDSVIRYGGEEFLVLLPDTDAAGAAALAEKLRGALAAECGREIGGVTASLGVAAARGAIDAEALLRAADRALYAAKAGGRNRVCVAGAERAEMTC